MSEIAAMIVGSEKLTSIFGRWPSFHDAEVHDLHFWRGHVDTQAKIYNFPALTVKIHLWLMTNEVNERGYYVLTNHTLASIRFLDVDDFKMEDFNQQNVISGLIIEQKIRQEGHAAFLSEFHASFHLRLEIYGGRIPKRRGHLQQQAAVARGLEYVFVPDFWSELKRSVRPRRLSLRRRLTASPVENISRVEAQSVARRAETDCPPMFRARKPVTA